MDLAGLIQAFRQEADDRAVPYLWPDAALTDWLNEAVSEALARAPWLQDGELAGPLQQASDAPALAERWQRGLLDWVLHRAFSCRDADRYDELRAAGYLQRFTLRFGEADNAQVLGLRQADCRWQTRPARW